MRSASTSSTAPSTWALARVCRVLLSPPTSFLSLHVYTYICSSRSSCGYCIGQHHRCLSHWLPTQNEGPSYLLPLCPMTLGRYRNVIQRYSYWVDSLFISKQSFNIGLALVSPWTPLQYNFSLTRYMLCSGHPFLFSFKYSLLMSSPERTNKPPRNIRSAYFTHRGSRPVRLEHGNPTSSQDAARLTIGFFGCWSKYGW